MGKNASTIGGVLGPLGLIAAVAAIVSGCETPSPHTISRNYSLREGVPVEPAPPALGGAG